MTRPKHLMISLFIVAIIGLHGLPILQKLWGRDQTLWPIMAWGMYKNSRSADEPIQTFVKRLTATTATGKELEIRPRNAGLNFHAFQRMYMRGLNRRDAATAERLLQRLNYNRQDPVVAIRLESLVYTITDSGLVETAEPPFVYRSGS